MEGRVALHFSFGETGLACGLGAEPLERGVLMDSGGKRR